LNLIIIPIVLVRRLLIPLACLGALASMAVPGWAQTAPRPEIVATTPVLGSILRDVVGDEARVTVVMPNGADPHEFQPSARDVGGLATADLVVANGRGLEEGLEDPLRQAEQDGTPVVDATDLVTLRRFDPSARDEIAEHGPDDPHVWTDPLTMRQLVAGLVPVLREEAGIDVAARAAKLQDRLTDLDAQIRATLADVPPARRTLVTGHESMGYFAARYGFRVVGALIPSLSSQAEASARNLADLRRQVQDAGVPAIFSDTGTPAGLADAIADETGARVVEVGTHALPPDGSYLTMMRDIAAAVDGGLAGPAPHARAEAGLGPLIDPFLDNDFMLRALVAGCLVALACAVVGTFVVLRGLAFIGDALAHGVLPGIAGALLLGLPGLAGAFAGAAAMIGGVSLVRRRSRLSGDTAIGLLFVGMLALGVVIVSRSDSFTGDLTRILFGEVLGISWADIGVQALATVLVAAVAAICARPFLMLSFDRDQTRVAGFSAELHDWLMLGLVAVTVVVSFGTVGTLLVFGMLIAPPATAALVARRVGPMMGIAAAVGVVSVVAGLLLSYHADLAAGASIVLVEVAVFFATLTARGALRPAPAVAA
jgi:ABC-type Mn2+/Zn2+ transport system permease subunit/ABC-type Zn uptake system ZnuABC Zn-binding protein ZnuA